MQRVPGIRFCALEVKPGGTRRFPAHKLNRRTAREAADVWVKLVGLKPWILKESLRKTRGMRWGGSEKRRAVPVTLSGNRS